MCHDEIPADDAGDRLPITARTSALGVTDFNDLLSRLKYVTASVVGARLRNNPYTREYYKSKRGRASAGYYRSRNRIKRNASALLRRTMIRDGISRPTHCDECRRECRPEGHHDDYSKPLDVRWLCRLCHKKWHAQHGEALNG